jgi:hypothetical protein
MNTLAWISNLPEGLPTRASRSEGTIREAEIETLQKSSEIAFQESPSDSSTVN